MAAWADFQNGRLTAITVKDGLYNNGVFQILEDDAGKLLDDVESRHSPRGEGTAERIRRRHGCRR